MSQTIEEKAPQVDAGGQAGPEPSLTGRVVKGAAWVFAGKLVGRGMSLVRLIVLARLLSPEDFGLFGIVMLAIATLETFTQTGFNTALIQRKDNTEDYLDTAWTVQIIRGLVLAGLVYASAPLVGWFFNEARAIPLLRVMCISVALGGFVNIGTIYFRKELKFHKQFVYDLVPAVLSLIVGVILAYRLRSVWALVWAGLAAAPARVLLSYAIHPYRPRLHWSSAQAALLFRFGRWVLASSILVLLLNHGDDAFLGKLLGAASLGLYQMAYRISNLPATEITHLVGAVTFPAYSKIQNETSRLRQSYTAIYALTAATTVPLTALIALFADPLVPRVLGETWRPAVPAIQVLAVWGFIRSLGAHTGPLWVATGKPHLPAYFQAVKLCLLAVTIYPFTKAWGVTGTALAVVCQSVVVHAVGYWFLARSLECRVSHIVKHLVLPCAAAAVATLAIFIADVPTGHWIGIISNVLLWCTAYSAVFLFGTRWDTKPRQTANRIFRAVSSPTS